MGECWKTRPLCILILLGGEDPSGRAACRVLETWLVAGGGSVLLLGKNSRDAPADSSVQLDAGAWGLLIISYLCGSHLDSLL